MGDKNLLNKQHYVVEDFCIHPADLETIKLAATYLRMDVQSFIEIAPYLYAKKLILSEGSFLSTKIAVDSMESLDESIARKSNREK